MEKRALNKVFHSHIRQYQVLSPVRLYGDYQKTFETTFTSRDSSVYFVVKSKAAQWLPRSFRFKRDYQLVGQLEVDGSVHDVNVDMADFWYSAATMQSHFRSKEAMSNYFMRRSDGFPWRLFPHDIRYLLTSSVVKHESEPGKLIVDCALSRNMTVEANVRADLYVYQAINHFGFPAPKLEIVYIGSSVSDAFDRVQHHERWGQMHAEKKRDEDLLVYFVELESDLIETRRVNGSATIARLEHSLSRDDVVRISESALINYFKPQYNKLNKHRPIKETNRIKKVLRKDNYDSVAVEVMLDGSMGAVGTELVGFGEHTAQHSIV